MGGNEVGDESYSGGDSYFKLIEAGKDIFAYDYIQPVHQGRAAEKVLLPALIREGQYAISNMFFDTTRAHIGLAGGRALDCVCDEALDTSTYHAFKGNMNIKKLEALIKDYGSDKIGLILMTITNNAIGGQPVSMENMKLTSENAYFIKEREEKYKGKSINEIVKEFFSYADAFTMSAKKDAIVNMGGLIGVKDNEEISAAVKTRVIPYEGFLTYGGLAGRNLEALAVGLYEGMDYDYLKYRIGQVEYLGDKLLEYGIPFQYLVGGHAIFV
jgi:tryptophanase